MRTQWPVSEAALLERTTRVPGWEPLFNSAAGETIAAFERPLNAVVRAALEAGLATAVAAAGMAIDFSLKNPRAVAYMKEHGAQLVSQINDTTPDQIRTIIARALDEGRSYDKTARTLSDKFEQFAVGAPQEHIDSRAHLIAVTETATAYEYANSQAMRELVDAGLEMEKSWVDVGDERECEDCSGNAGAGWISFSDDFPSGVAEAPAHPACRCTVAYRRVGTGQEKPD
jgi:SPP1 gp7 family putative phage head morphogenesis protein